MENSRLKKPYPMDKYPKDDSDKDIFYLPVTTSTWQIDMRELPKLFISCNAIDDTYETKLKLKKMLKIENIDNIYVNLRYAIFHLKTSAEGILARQQANVHNLMFKGEDMLLGNAVPHLGFGRHEIIRDYRLTNVVLECKSISERNRVEVNDLAEKHGVVIHLKVIDGLAFIEYRDFSSVISIIAVENDETFRGDLMVAKLNDENLKSLVVKAKYISLVRGADCVYVNNLKDMQFDDDKQKINELKKVFAAFGTVKLVRIMGISAFVEFSDMYSAHKALNKKLIARTKYVTWFIKVPNSGLKGVIKTEEISKDSTYQNNINKSFLNDRERLQTTNLNPVASIPQTDYISLLNSIIPFSTNTQPPNKPDQSNTAKEQNLSNKPLIVNDVEVICTMPTCLEYSKNICRSLQSLDLKVGVINPPENYDINSVVDSMKTSGVKAIVFVDITNAKTETLSAKFLDNSLIKMKDIPLNLAVQEFARAFGRNVIEEIESELQAQPQIIINHEKVKPSSDLENLQKTSKSDSLTKTDKRHMKELCGRIAREHPISLSENDQLIKYLTEQRSKKVSKEYGDYIPSSLKTVPVGPFGDRQLKVERENIEDSVEEIIGRFFTEDDHEKSVKDTEVNKDKIASAITTLLTLNKAMKSNR